MDHAAAHQTVAETWDSAILPSLSALVEIPAVSPAYDAEWVEHGQLEAAIEHVRAWIAARGIQGVVLDVVRLPGRTPLLLVDVPATDTVFSGGDTALSGGDTVLLYGHLDKQPPMDGWSEGLEPWTPVVRDGRLYGRGSVDDGYSGYAAVAAIEAVRAHGGAHRRCVLLLETGEESGSPDMSAYLEHLADRLGTVSLVVCLDAGGGDYDRLWLTTSLRGLAQVDFTVSVLDSGQHSGMSSGIVPSSFRVIRTLLDRLEDSETGEVLLPELTVDVPEDRAAELRAAVRSVPGMVRDLAELPEGMRPVSDDEYELALNNMWRSTLSVVGAAGMPAPENAGNVLRPSTTLALSLRLPPTADPDAALKAIENALSTDVPYGASVTFGEDNEATSGWNAPETAPWLTSALDAASDEVFGGEGWRTLGMGGSIPLMGPLHRAYPQAQFVVTGALGPGSNAHVPDESLDLAYAAKVTTAIAYVLDAHARS